MTPRKNTSRRIVLLLNIALGLSGINLTGWRVVANSAPSLMQSTVYFTDFTGNSKDVPADWTDIGFDTSPESTVVEKGSVVAITDIRPAMGAGGGPQLIQSNFTFAAPSDPVATVTLTADIASTMTNTPSGESQVIVGLGNVNGYAVVAAFNNTKNELHINLVQGGVPVAPLLGPTLLDPGQARGQFDITLTFNANSFRLATGNFDSGNLPYTSAGIAGFDSLGDFGANVGIILGASAEGNSSGDIISTVNFDSVLLDLSATGLSSIQEINALISKVDSLSAKSLTSPQLTPSQANLLRIKLNKALTQLKNGQTGDACTSIEGFISQVTSCISDGPLSPTAGLALINDASAIKTSLGC